MIQALINALFMFDNNSKPATPSGLGGTGCSTIDNKLNDISAKEQ
jgi:hypothetical protein